MSDLARLLEAQLPRLRRYARALARGPQPLKNAGITVGELIGWRIWRVSHGALMSYSANYGWMPGHPAEGKPDDHGGGGIWCFKEPGRALAKLREVDPGALGSIFIMGRDCRTR